MTSEMTPDLQQPQKPSQSFANLIFNIILPILILNQLSKRLGENGPLIALLVALAVPLAYGIYEYSTSHKRNWLSLFGIINILLTGGLALLELDGFWFAIKEAAVPFVIAVFVLASAMTKRPLIEMLLYNESLMKTGLVKAKLKELNLELEFHKHLQKSTVLLSSSFFLSAILNFLLAKWVFSQIDPTLDPAQRAQVLNEQIANMTWLGFLVIALPSMIVMLFTMWYLGKGIKRYTGFSFMELLHEPPSKKA
jgi:intracellular septation protein A